jgi:hypothetical protein
MKRTILVIALAGWMGMPSTQKFGFAQGQNLLSPGSAPADSAMEADGFTAAVDNADSKAYADGVRAINAGHWSDAISIFSRIAEGAGDHAGGALYWEAYAENKLGQSAAALGECGKLRAEHSDSKWIEDCGALEIEIKAQSGRPVPPQTEPSDELKLLALASLMQRDEKKALLQIDEILNSDSSQKLKDGALFIMGQHHSDTIYPQIARVAYVEGDVRITRGLEKHGKNLAWEQAANDVPLETGFSLVTGENGRAEIELEDASILYLGENSVLTFNDLHTLRGLPYTDVALLTGTLTMHVRPITPGDVFVLRTPTDSMAARYPQSIHLRVNSYTDGIGVTSLGTHGLAISGADNLPLAPGREYYFKDGRRTIDAGPIKPPDFAAWDQWVAGRYFARMVAMAQMQKAAGLTSPLPGLADMRGAGNFISCEPYGTCWEPTTPQAQVAQVVDQASKPDSPQVSAQNQLQSAGGQTSQAVRHIGFIGKPTAPGSTSGLAAPLDEFPCAPDAVRTQMRMNLYPGSQSVSYLNSPRWAWAACHSGSWIYRGHRYLWVVGGRHHHPPVHWIKQGNTVGFVPSHPHDVKGRPPINRTSPVFAINNHGQPALEKIELSTTRPIAVLKEAPREFRSTSMPPLPHAEEPRMEAHAIKDMTAAKGTPVRSAAIPITFDHKSQSFVMPHQEMHGGRSVTVNAPISNRSGNLQAGTNSLGGARGGSGGTFGGHSSGGSTAGSSGGSHSGGSTSSASTSSSSGSVSSGSSSAGSSSAGSHH